jgi:hypothetical protein
MTIWSRLGVKLGLNGCQHLGQTVGGTAIFVLKIFGKLMSKGLISASTTKRSGLEMRGCVADDVTDCLICAHAHLGRVLGPCYLD